MANVLQFNGNNYLATNVIPSTSGTIETWYNAESFFNYNTIWDNSIGGNDWECWIYSSGILAARLQSTGQIVSYDLVTNNIGTNKWFHIALTWQNGGNKNLYINGNLVSSNSASYISAGNLFLAGGNAGNTKGKGKYSDFRIWNTLRTQQQIQDNMYKRLRGNEEGLFAYWKLNELSGTTAYDSSIYGKNATINGGATYVNDSSLSFDLYTKLDWLQTEKYNYYDVNRLESNMQELATLIQAIGYTTGNYTFVTNRTATDIEYISSINRIEDILEDMQSKFGVPSFTFTTLDSKNIKFSDLGVGETFATFDLSKKKWYVGTTFSYLDANRWENLVSLFKYYTEVIPMSYQYCGTFDCGEDGGLL